MTWAAIQVLVCGQDEFDRRCQARPEFRADAETAGILRRERLVFR